MRNYILTTLLLLVLGALPGQAQKAMQLAEDAACKCMEEKYDKANTYKVNEKVAEECLMNAFIENYDAFTSEYSTESLMDDKFTYKLGEELGTNLATNCPTFLEFSLQMLTEGEGLEEEEVAFEESPMPPPPPPSVEKTTGKLSKVEDGVVRVITLQTAEGPEEFIWLVEIGNSKDFVDMNSYKGKNLTITWTLKYIFSPKDKRYVYRKEVMSITEN